MSEIEGLHKNITNLCKENDELEELILKYRRFDCDISNSADYSKTIELMDDIEDLHNCISKKEAEYQQLRRFLDNYAHFEDEINDYDEELKNLNSQMPDICPLCGGKLDAEHKDSM